MDIGIRLQSISLKNSQDSIQLDGDDIVVVVGPNSSGKTQLLNDISSYKNPNTKKIIVDDIQFKTVGDQAQMKNLLQSSTVLENNHYYFVPFSTGNRVGLGHKAYEYWEDYNNYQEQFWTLFVDKLSTTSRLTIANSAKAIKPKDPQSHIFHKFRFSNSELNDFNKHFYQAFGKYLVADIDSGQEFDFYSTRQIRSTTTNSIAKYRDWVEEYVKEKGIVTNNEGDGIKGYIGVVGTLGISHCSVLCIDEPDAFLHPPQAEILGKTIPAISQGKQVFLATHSLNFVKGILDSDNPRIKLVKLARKGNKTKLKILDKDLIKELLSDPILKYSNILNCLFNDKVIITEADMDCSFYNFTLDEYKRHNSKKKIGSVLFVHTSTKDRMHKLVTPMKKLGIDIHIIADIDLVRSKKTLKITLEKMGGDYQNISTEVERIRQKYIQKSRVKKYWKDLKDRGINAFGPRTSYRKDINRIVEYCEGFNIYILPYGEVESFDQDLKTSRTHGPKWLIKYFEKHKALSKNSGELKFIEKVIL